MFDDRSAYPHPDEFKVMRPEYFEPEDDAPADEIIAQITISPFKVKGRSISRAGARRAALYEAAKTYREYHPSHRIGSPFPDHFTDHEGTEWHRVPEHRRSVQGDYRFVLDGDDEDFADIEQMLMWDVRPVQDDEA